MLFSKKKCDDRRIGKITLRIWAESVRRFLLFLPSDRTDQKAVPLHFLETYIQRIVTTSRCYAVFHHLRKLGSSRNSSSNAVPLECLDRLTVFL